MVPISMAIIKAMARCRPANTQPQGPDGGKRTLNQALKIAIPSDDVQGRAPHQADGATAEVDCVGSPSRVQASNPPSMTLTLWCPFLIMCRARLALVASLGQVQ